MNKLICSSLHAEFSLQVVAADQIPDSDDDDDQQLNGCIEEEEFSVKVEPTYDDDDEITSDPLNLSENGDDLDPVGNSVESPFVCTMCQPNVTFTSAKTRMVHMRNKNFHPDVAAAINSREFCKIIFTGIITLIKGVKPCTQGGFFWPRRLS